MPVAAMKVPPRIVRRAVPAAQHQQGRGVALVCDVVALVIVSWVP